MQSERRRDPYPWSWEIAAGALLLVLALIVVSTQLGRALANVSVSGSWVLPPLTSWVASTLSVLGGDAAAGISGHQAPVASRDLLWAWVAGVHVLASTLAAGVAVATRGRWGSGGVRGLASRGEVAQLLTRRRLHRVRAVIRPDLCGPSRPRRHIGRARRKRR